MREGVSCGGGAGLGDFNLGGRDAVAARRSSCSPHLSRLRPLLSVVDLLPVRLGLRLAIVDVLLVKPLDLEHVEGREGAQRVDDVKPRQREPGVREGAQQEPCGEHGAEVRQPKPPLPVQGVRAHEGLVEGVHGEVRELRGRTRVSGRQRAAGSRRAGGRLTVLVWPLWREGFDPEGCNLFVTPPLLPCFAVFFSLVFRASRRARQERRGGQTDAMAPRYLGRGAPRDLP